MTETARAFWEAQVEATPDAPAILSAGEAWSYAAFDATVNRLANGLRVEGVRAGAKVAALLPNSVDFLRLQLALAKLGAITVPLIAGSTSDEASYVLDHSEAEILITDAAGGEVVKSKIRMLVGPDPESAGSLLSFLDSGDESAPPEPGIGPLSPLAIMYTSGSTGRPKGVVQPSASLGSAGRALTDALGLDARDNILCALPFFHTAATHMAFGSAVGCGGTLTLMPRFSREAFWPVARETGATISYLFPAQMSILLTAAPSPDDRDNKIRLCFSHVRNEVFCDRFGIDVCPGWAMTETCGMGTVTRPSNGIPSIGGIGVPYPASARVRILDPDGREVDVGERGEIWFAHPHVMSGYYRDPVNTGRSLRDGWVGSGDIGWLDARGVLHFAGRVKNLIKRSGENISGEEVEFTLMGHPAVEEAVVFAVPDEIRTEEVFAVVLVRDGHGTAAEELAAWCRERLSAWKTPRYVELRRGELPRLANGKVNRSQVIAGADLTAAWQDAGMQRAGSRR